MSGGLKGRLLKETIYSFHIRFIIGWLKLLAQNAFGITLQPYKDHLLSV
jgi:hypothetical protein